MNYKQFVEIYKQGPEELYRLFKVYEKTIDSLNGKVMKTGNIELFET